MSDMTAKLAQRMIARRDTTVTSTMTIGEVMVKPLAFDNQALQQKYDDLFNRKGIEVIDFDRAAAMEYAVIRRDKYIKAPDAIQLACAVSAKCDLFVTNDDRLSKKIIPGIQFIVSLDRIPI